MDNSVIWQDDILKDVIRFFQAYSQECFLGNGGLFSGRRSFPCIRLSLVGLLLSRARFRFTGWFQVIGVLIRIKLFFVLFFGFRVSDFFRQEIDILLNDAF